MQVRSVPFHDQAEVSPAQTQVVMLEVSGRLDQSNPTIRGARELIEQIGSTYMLDAFNRAVLRQSQPVLDAGSAQ